MALTAFNPSHYGPNAKITDDPQRADMEAGMKEFVYGQKVVAITQRRFFDPEASLLHKRPVEVFEVEVELENGILHVTRLVVNALSIVVRGDGLAQREP